MNRRKIMASMVAAIGLGAIACSSEPTGLTHEAIGEANCAYRTISAPNGATTSDWQVACGGLSQSSSNGQYGYTNCTNGYIWEISQIDSDGGCDGRKLNVNVSPTTLPSTQTQCVATYAKFYLYGLDTVNGIQYNWSTQPALNTTYCTWNSFTGCSCSNATVTGVDLDNWPDGNGGTVSVNGMRVVGQVYEGGSVGNYVTLTETLSEYDFGTCCVHAPPP